MARSQTESVSDKVQNLLEKHLKEIKALMSSNYTLFSDSSIQEIERHATVRYTKIRRLIHSAAMKVTASYRI